MTVVQPNSISGINSITVQSGESLSIHKSDGSLLREIVSATGVGTFYALSVGTAGTVSNTGNAALAGIVTANGGVVVGAAATIYANGNITCGIITCGADVSISGSGLDTGDNVGLKFGDGDDFLVYHAGGGNGPNVIDNTSDDLDIRHGAASRLRVRTDGRISIGSSLAVTGVCTAAAFVPSQGQISNRNTIINGDMNVAQRATSSTTSGYGDVDRWQHEYAGTDENPTFAQVDVTSGDAPYLVGLTRAAKITNGNQTSGLQATSQINFMQPIEAQDIRNCGWNYKSASSYITLSYWVRASVAQEYHGFVKTADGSNYIYPFSLGSLSANTWTKITKTIPGNSNLQIDNDNGTGLQVWPVAFYGTDYTASGVTNNAWAAWASASRSTDQTSTWWTTNDSTFEITGVQLEVGSYATPFEHRSYGDELFRCQRYFQLLGGSNGTYDSMATGSCGSATVAYVPHRLVTTMRATPSFTLAGSASDFRYTRGGDQTPSNITLDQAGQNMVALNVTISSATADNATRLFNINTTGGLQFSAEL